MKHYPRYICKILLNQLSIYSWHQKADVTVNYFYTFALYTVRIIYTLCGEFTLARTVEPYPEIH
jgi:hypothetical protein